ncbi:MAG: hypothetical protein Q9174_006600 [Haloplaca sp. 1 TL-2023]
MARNSTANQQQQPNIWHQMQYAPPRGPCFQKSSILTSCPCFRFMLHPLKGATSFECDGCGHHASFHKKENREDEEIERRWKDADASEAQLESDLRMWSEHIGDQKKRLDIEMARNDAEQARLDKERADDTDDGLEVVEGARNRGPKRKRTNGR